MKRLRLSLVSAGLALSSFASAQAAIETYDIDPVHSWVGFTVQHFFTKVPGFFGQANGTFVVDRDHLENSSVDAVIAAASITTNSRMRDDDLRSTNFFAAVAFPTLHFKSKAWKSTGRDTYAVTGDLMIKSVKECNYALAAICCSVLTCTEGVPPPLEYSEETQGIRKLIPVRMREREEERERECVCVCLCVCVCACVYGMYARSYMYLCIPTYAEMQTNKTCVDLVLA
jgi:hypothetical protein